MSCFSSEALARKLNNSAVHDFPRVYTDKILHIQSYECGGIKLFHDR